jgi:ubiquinone/menaquinone biosynthesis C-methylase UbiE
MPPAVDDHWEAVYRTGDARSVSWFRPHLDVSLRLLERAGLGNASHVIDVGGGASTLVDDLVARGVAHVTVLDLSDTALDVARRRLRDRAMDVTWCTGDVTRIALAPAAFDLWHDRAVLHFLTDAEPVAAYVRQVERALRPGGHAVIGGFASDGPERCSGLPVARRDPRDIAETFGPAFDLVDEAREEHTTPGGATQRFAYAVLRRRPAPHR